MANTTTGMWSASCKAVVSPARPAPTTAPTTSRAGLYAGPASSIGTLSDFVGQARDRRDHVAFEHVRGDQGGDRGYQAEPEGEREAVDRADALLHHVADRPARRRRQGQHEADHGHDEARARVRIRAAQRAAEQLTRDAQALGGAILPSLRAAGGGVLGAMTEITAGAMERMGTRFATSTVARVALAGGFLAGFSAIAEGIQAFVKGAQAYSKDDEDASLWHQGGGVLLTLSGIAGLAGALAIASGQGALTGALSFLAGAGTAAATIPVWGWIAAGVLFLGVGLAMLWQAIKATDTPLEQWLKHAALEMQEYVRLTAAGCRGIFSRPFYRHDVIEQIDVIGIGSMTVILLTGLFAGMALASQAGMTLDQFGARPFVGRLISASMIKELGPVLTGLMLAGRIGSGIAAELGSMVVTDQIAALRALGTDPVRKLVVPRVIAGTLMVPILTIISDGIGMVGGLIISVTQLKVAGSIYWTNVVEGLFLQDLWMGLIKPVVLGFTLVTIGCHVGLRTSGGTQGVGRATTNAVVGASVAVLVLDFLLTKALIVLLY